MPAPEVSAEALAARLCAIGLTTRVLDHTRHTSIEAEIPDSLPAETWREVLDVAGSADRFGLLATSLGGRTLWAAVNKAVPATGDVRGPGRQR
ncbi:hypothetical protein AB0B13_08780 [Streptomyces sp. NPDC042898]|uniref:hypothetical protein n=1 Tax=Streptomyces sp. NPDC042898 TaxID=3154334 RepID=UPI0033FEF5D9